MAAIDILYLLDRLEEVLNSGSRVPLLGSRTLIDEGECLDILDQIRVALPEEIKQARRITTERDNIIAEADTRAQQVVREAEERAAALIQEHTLVRQAQARAEQVEGDAERRSAEIRREADEYVYQTLTELENDLEQLLVTVRKGTRALRGGEAPRPPRRANNFS